MNPGAALHDVPLMSPPAAMLGRAWWEIQQKQQTGILKSHGGDESILFEGFESFCVTLTVFYIL